MTNYKTEQHDHDKLCSTDKVLSWKCKGKFIYILLDDGDKVADFSSSNHSESGDYCRSIWITLGMTGRFLNGSHPKAKHARWRFDFLDTSTNTIKQIFYHDTRNFGTLKFSLSANELEKKLLSLGYDLLNELIFDFKEQINLKKIESLEKKLINNLDENSFSELIKLKSQINKG